MSDEELIAMHLTGDGGFFRHETEREMERRQLNASRDLRLAILDFKGSADQSARWMTRLTIIIAVLTVLIAKLTVSMVLRGS
jgi:hypothetical protein